ncbi:MULTISPECIES: fimbrial protein [Burkholderia]|uniref:fimbrial protein n=1 Tax=Burkholderia TaxID=32008 RepID=UPI0009E668E6|nr:MULTISPECIES: fimbrial protein [Burkholderia]
MKTKQKNVLNASAALLLGMGVIVSAYASDGEVDFQGIVTAQTCTVDATSKNLNVPLPTVSANSLAKPGDAVGSQLFTIKVSDCSSGTKAVAAAFEANASLDASTGNLKNQSDDTAAAKNVEIQLMNSDSSPITVGNASTVKSTPVVSGSASMDYRAKYVAVDGAATAGPVQSHVTYSLNYQ